MNTPLLIVDEWSEHDESQDKGKATHNPAAQRHGEKIMNVEERDVSPTLRRETHGHEPIVVLEDDGTKDNNMPRNERRC